ncbi:hypothetical protein C8R48DRAFT_749237 [Suillus tomentosus]|nr:hypothetical protein C8R48DRAFT_749237 [Suillus tomentosus]
MEFRKWSNSENLFLAIDPRLSNRGIIPGIQPSTTQGLDDLLPRLQGAVAAEARRSKWRASILCNSSSLPTRADLEVQAEILSRCVAISTQAVLTIVEPDVDFTEDLKKSIGVHSTLLSASLEHSSHSTTSAEDVGLATAIILSCPVPIAIAGVVYLSGKTFVALSCPPYPKLIFLCGGLSDPDSVRSLNAVNVIANEKWVKGDAGAGAKGQG